MHELGIANSILEAVRTEVAKVHGRYATKVSVRIGEMTAVDPEALRFSFDVLTQDTDLARLQLEVQICPLRNRCEECGEEFVVHDFDIQCPKCRSLRTKFLSGDEFALDYLEVEEYGTSSVGAQSTE
jgi:hydrogenase nickel incorporation protein HypA/HybF